MSIKPVLADSIVSISEFKKNPMAVIKKMGGEPICVINRNKPAFYCISADTYERLMDQLEDAELAEIVRTRMDNPCEEITLEELSKL